MKEFFRTLVDANTRVSIGLERYLPHARPNPFELYADRVAALFESETPLTIADIGGGRSCTFAHLRPRGNRSRIVAVDISADELALNDQVDEKRVADVVERLPFADGELDAIVSSSLLEHLRDVDAFIESSARALKPGGRWIHVLPSKFAPFSIANQLLPRRLGRRVLFSLLPETQGKCGFRAYYDRCYYSALLALLERHGFEVEEVYVGYFQSWYLSFFLPAFLASALYELVIYKLGAKNLAAYLVVSARRR
jgi:2-polyprenyl-6-hydroxyphenyl methylase/3-demethylubiquinone-9 3-methyltransferase